MYVSVFVPFGSKVKIKLSIDGDLTITIELL